MCPWVVTRKGRSALSPHFACTHGHLFSFSKVPARKSRKRPFALAGFFCPVAHMIETCRAYEWAMSFEWWLCVCVCVCVCEQGRKRAESAFEELAAAQRTLAGILQRAATCCNTLQHAATCCSVLQWTTTHYNALQHTATHCNTMEHTATYSLLPSVL